MPMTSLQSLCMRPPEHLQEDARTIGRPSTVDQHIDALTSTLDDPNARTRRGASTALGRLGVNIGMKGATLACRLGDADTHTRVNTALALLRNGMPTATKAMEQAKRLMNGDARNRQGCVEALIRMGRPGAAALAGVLDHPNSNPELRRLIAEALGKMGSEASEQANVLAQCIGDADEWVRVHTAESLCLIGTPFSPRIGELVKSLDDDTSDLKCGVSQQGQAATRRRALQAMGQRGAQSAPYAQEIASHLNDGDPGVRRRAAESLARIGVCGEVDAVSPHGRALTKCLHDRNAFVRTSAVEALLQMGPAAEAYTSDLAQCLRDSDADVRRKAIDALGRIGMPAAGHIQSMSVLLRDEDVGCRRCCVEAMLNMGMHAAPFAHDIANLLDDRAVGLRWTIVEGLQNLGMQGAQALAIRMQDEDPITRETAKATLQQMGWRASDDGRSMLQEPTSARTARTLRAQQHPESTLPAHLRMRSHAPGALSWSAR